MSVTDVLRQVSLFADLRDDEMVVLADGLGRRVFAKDAILFHQGSPAQSLYLIESGVVCIYVESEIGQEITLDVYGAGECFGETALLDGDVRSASAMALERTVAYTLRREEFLRCLEQHSQVARRVMMLLAHRLEHAIVYAQNLAFLDVAARVATVLVELVARYGAEGGSVEIEVPLTQAQLASWVSASREMVNKVLRAYRDQGLITMQGHTIVITDLAGLKRKTGHCTPARSTSWPSISTASSSKALQAHRV